MKTQSRVGTKSPARYGGAVWLAVVVLAFLSIGCAEFAGVDLGSILPSTGPPSAATVADGLRQALTIGTERASTQLSARGGFAANPQIRLGLPEQLESVASALRAVGLGGRVDELVDTMNAAAENAAGEAVPVFADAIRAMRLEDAMAILNGPDDAATRYFRDHTAGPLRDRFAPVVDQSMQSVGLYAQYRDLMARYDALPFTKPAAPDLADYVTSRTLDGLFSVLAEEEKAIREDPAARTTALLRRVFGGASTP